MRKLAERIGMCRTCQNLNLRNISEATPGFGDLYSPVMVIGQSLHTIHPNFLHQIPFVNPRGKTNSGDLIFQAIMEAGLHLWDLFITNTIHCHPEKNRPTSTQEKKKCRHFLLEEIDIVRPQLIIALGADASKVILGGNWQVPKPVKRSVFLGKGNFFETRVFSLCHPAYFLYKPSAAGQKAWIKTFRKLLEKHCPR